jgi:outer membrane receptor protein involved in Fe transport
LVISSVGYKTQEVNIAGKKVIKVTLLTDTKQLEEVVVVGYGVQKKKLVTGATLQIKGDNVEKLNTTSALTALQSQSPGVNIIQSSGQPGEGFKVNIRGMGTIGDSQPLYVIDGVAGVDINTLNPADIESIDVLKDAASALSMVLVLPMVSFWLLQNLVSLVRLMYLTMDIMDGRMSIRCLNC